MRRLDDVDVCLLVWREAPRMLERFHGALAAALGDGWFGRLVLVENAAPRATADAAEALVRERYPSSDARVVLRSSRNLGYARAMDLALDACSGRYVALLNSDGLIAPDALRALAAALDADPGAVWAAPAVHGPGERCEPPGPAFPEEELAGTALLVRRERFAELGGLDPAYWFYQEDYEASRRIRRAGGTLLRVPEAVFSHGKGGRSGRGRLWRELCFAATWQLFCHQHEPSHRAAAARLARGRARSLEEHRGDPWALTGLVLAALLWPLTALVGADRRRRPWSGPRLQRWLARHRSTVERIEL